MKHLIGRAESNQTWEQYAEAQVVFGRVAIQHVLVAVQG